MKRSAFVGVAGAGLLAGVPAAARATATATSDDAKYRPDVVYRRRVAAAAEARAAYKTSRANGDEARYAASGYLGSYAKGLPHEANGNVYEDSFQSMVRAIDARNPALLDFFASRTLHNLVAIIILPNGELAGCDYTGYFVPPAPTLASARTAADAIELYWQALTRDVPVVDYDTDPTIAKACADLSRLTDFDAPRVHGAITPQTIFRGPGRTLSGPYLSQFFWLDVPIELGQLSSQRRSMPVRHDYLTDRTSWLAAQDGRSGVELTPRDGSLRYMQTGRDLADYLWQLNSLVAWRNAAAIVGGLPDEARTGEFDFDDIVAMMSFASSISGVATLYQKMFIHRRARPEAFGGLVDRGPKASPLHPDIWTTPALELVRARYDSHLLPQAYLEGCPTHPTYPSGHAALAGTGVTVLKALVNESYVLPAPVVPSRDGLRLEPYKGPPLTLGGELDKLAENIALGRGAAGVHFRSDSYAGLRNGEAATLSLMRDRVTAIGDGAPVYSLTTVDGAKVRIAPDDNSHIPKATRST
ncbi:MAG: vanadium-dependent haloperoxidase [Candidatus Velthaea sp.]